MKLAKYVMKKLKRIKECIVSENSCSKNFVYFQEKHPSEIAFLNKVAGYQTLTGIVFWKIHEIFRAAFTRKPENAGFCN